ncbi:aminomethyl-transferring glycine dehydrogenase [Prosthecobacter sp. SYSU 5D2]|uniref:aminomethyl-transferring glycine dehydrogenase n=1 Tax=Prosthecobacter sp. SYSU 5D2 TaxID=3134134 RepID=UPI0031FE726D
MPTPFSSRHIGPSAAETAAMLETLGYDSLDTLVDHVVPEAIRQRTALNLPEALGEEEALRRLRQLMGRNKVVRSFIGLGYHDTFTPPVIQRNILENPGWYTAYTPYQPEISQGRLEALINFQTMVTDLTGLDVAGASLLDEGTACAEALTLAAAQKAGSNQVLVSDQCHPHNIEVVRTRMSALGIEVVVTDVATWQHDGGKGLAAVLVQYPDTQGVIHDFEALARQVHEAGALLVVSADLLALTVLRPPGEFGADICVGNSQRFGVPLGFGGPHAAFMAVKDALKRRMPGRLIGVSRDAAGNPAYRLSLQTREQHIRREKATSNICTAQVLLAVMASMYAVYHGPEGLKKIALRTHGAAVWLARELLLAGLELASDDFFDTLTVRVHNADEVLKTGLLFGVNLRKVDAHHVGVALDERIREEELHSILKAFGVSKAQHAVHLTNDAELNCSGVFHRQSAYLTHPVFSRYHSETEMMRYLHKLESKDIALNRSMIPLGSCTMKLNAAAEMMPLSWPEVGGLHPYAPHEQSEGYHAMFAELESWLAECTGFDATSLQPNAGSQGEYAGLLAIKRFHEAQGEGHRDVCLIPTSAHGTNPASAVMCAFKVVAVVCDDQGNISVADLQAKLEAHKDKVAALMVTYPSTHGVFEESIVEICRLVHEHGGQVYMDGANMNAQVGLTSPGRIGADVCHLNLHKTFCIPHGGGGPGVGPICVAAHLKPYLPGHLTWEPQSQREGAVCSAPWGSASICTISWMYIAMMGPQLTDATKYAILNANYVARKLAPCFPTLYKGSNGLVAHECILDFRHFHKVTVEDVAKRLMDFGYHAPTMSWPVGGTLMIEPTESESQAELDRFCSAMQCIHGEIEAVENGNVHPTDNPLKAAPHTAEFVMKTDWPHPYTRETAAFPLPWVKDGKYWPPVARVDNVYGDRNLVCSCISVEEAAAG